MGHKEKPVKHKVKRSEVTQSPYGLSDSRRLHSTGYIIRDASRMMHPVKHKGNPFFITKLIV